MLKVNDLCSGYGKVQILNGASIEVGKGEIVSIIGRNGVGKSTFVKTLIGILPVKSGTILFRDGCDISKWPAYKRAVSGIAYVPQGHGVFPDLTVQENLKIGALINKKEREEAYDRIYDYFPRLAERRSQKAGTMSGGEDELEIRALNKQLESTVIERTDQLSKAYSDLESFSYTVSHELKTPIREIETYIEFIGEDNAGVLNEQSLKDIESIKNVCTNTMHLIQSMMEYSRVGYKALNNEYIDMNSVITECFSEIMKPVHDRKVRLETGDIPQIYGDKFLIKQLVFNIISNSVKFTQEKEEAVISVTADPSEDTVTLYFRDNGVGFKPNSNVHLFNVFDRMHNESDYEGSGIGLAMVKKIVKRFNGKVTIEGWPNKGCCVTVQLPANNMIQSFEN